MEFTLWLLIMVLAPSPYFPPQAKVMIFETKEECLQVLKITDATEAWCEDSGVEF